MHKDFFLNLYVCIKTYLELQDIPVQQQKYI